MNGINLSDSIKQFGCRDGISFYFRWSFIDPLKIFYWKYITAKPLCTYHGYFLCEPDCRAEKIYGRKNIINYEKERHKQIDIESQTIRGSDGICAYCNKDKGTEIIEDPNGDTLERWLVCKDCKEIIETQQERLIISSINPELAEKCNNKLLEIAKRTGKPIINATIYKDGEGYSAFTEEFTGEENGKS